MKTELLQMFCCQVRPGLSRPWSDGAYTWATDGRIMVRVPRMDDVPPNEEAPKAHKTFDMWLAVPTGPLPPLPPPWENTVCSECRGSGEVRCSACEHTHECTECGGGGGITKDKRWMRVDGVIFACSYVLKVAALPGVRVGISRAGDQCGLYFEFDGGAGICAGMSEIGNPEDEIVNVKE